MQVQWSRLRAERGLPRQRRARGSLESAIPEKRSVACLEDVTESVKFPRTLENADDSEVIGNHVSITSDGEYTEHEGATPDDSVLYQVRLAASCVGFSSLMII